MADIKKFQPSLESLMEIFGTTRPTKEAVIKWKSRWRNSKSRVEVKSFNAALKLLDESGIDPLLYQFCSQPRDESKFNSVDKFFVVFHNNEHEVFFKLHSDLA